MRKYTLSVAIVLASCLSQTVLAQIDSSQLDLGFLTLKKEFAQTITIHGADLEKMPFTNLSDAIAPWTYGAYATPGTLLYVVDGNPVTDPNIYDIHDIEEVVLVQNAIGTAGSIDGQQRLVLVRTRRGKAKTGFTAGVQSGLVNASGNGVNTDNRLYHQYYIGAYRNLNTISFGISAGFQRDVWPLQNDSTNTSTPLNLQRWRLNGYFSWRPATWTQVELSMNYTPQRTEVDYSGVWKINTPYPHFYSGTSKQYFPLPVVNWRSEILPGLKNELQATYLNSSYRLQDEQVESLNFNFNPAYVTSDDSTRTAHHLRIRDRLGYILPAGAWTIEPGVIASYENISEKYNEYWQGSQFNQPPPYTSLNVGAGYSTYHHLVSQYAKVWMLAPSATITYKRALDITGGVILDIGSEHLAPRKSFPFASLALDLFKLGGKERAGSLKIFGSYAQRTQFSFGSYALTGLSTELTDGNVPGSTIYVPGSTGGFVLPPAPFKQPIFWSWQAGTTFSAVKDRLQLQYAFERRNFFTLSYYTLPAGTGYAGSYAYHIWTATLHHFEIAARPLDGPSLKWESRLNITLLRNKTDTFYREELTGKPGPGEVASDPLSWTGGWVNRVRVQKFTAGLDLLYHFHETVYGRSSSNTYVSSLVNSVIIPNIYAGYSFHSIELFVESRGLVRNSKQDLMDQRKYYTLGGKFTIQ